MKLLSLLTISSVLIASNSWAAEPTANSSTPPDATQSTRSNQAAMSHCLGNASSPNASANCLLERFEPLKEIASNRSLIAEKVGSPGNSLTGADPNNKRFVAQDAFDGVQVSTSGRSGSISKTMVADSLRLSVNFDSYKGQISAVSVPTRHIPANKNSGLASAKEEAKKAPL